MPVTLEEILESLGPERRRQIEDRAKVLIDGELVRQKLRRAHELTEVELANSLGMAQKQISELEKRTDMHISTLRRSIEAMGGKLSIIAEFPDHAPILLKGLAELAP